MADDRPQIFERPPRGRREGQEEEAEGRGEEKEGEFDSGSATFSLHDV
jgi:hypothetical protein